MKKITFYFILTSLATAPLCAMPSQITFQGTLKQNGVPVNTGTGPGVDLQFSFLDAANGNQIQGSSVTYIANVSVNNGLFAVQLPIDQSIPWEQYSTPYVQVLVNYQNTGYELLKPNQPLSANLYSVSSFPQGMLAMFVGPCPSGWQRFARLDGAFPLGGAAYDPTPAGAGGSATYPSGQGVVFGTGQGSGSFQATWLTGDQTLKNGNVTILPPFVTVVYCVKL